MPLKTTRSTGLLSDKSPDFRGLPIQWLRTVYVQFLQTLFEYLPVGAYHWEDTNDTEIHIFDECPIKLEVIGARPAIAVVRAPLMMSSVGMDDMSSYDQQTGRKVKTTVLPGNMVLNCCSRSPIESENLAMFVAENLWMLRDVLQKNGGFFDVGRNYAIGSPSPAGAIVQGDSADKYFVTTVTCPFHMVRSSAVTELGLSVAHNLSLKLSAAAKQTAASVPSYEFPVASSAAVPSATYTGQSVPALNSLSEPGVTTKLNPPSIKGKRLV